MGTKGLIPVTILPEIEKLYSDFVAGVERRIDSGEDRYKICRDTLMELYGETESYDTIMNDPKRSITEKIRISCYDPHNITLEPEYYNNIDRDRFNHVKPLIWLWMMFDKTPAGRNLHLGLIFRRMLAKKVLRKSGENIKWFHNVEVSFGYNLEVGSNTVIHREVLLDDRGEIIIGNDASVSDYANIYSHSHSVEDISDISMGSTVIGDRSRVTYHSTVLSDVKIGHDAMLGAVGLATKNIQHFHINVGIPAKSVRVKKGQCCEMNCPDKLCPARAPETASK